jgi:hypothetical protein
MSRPGRPAQHTSSAFARWMAEMGFTSEQAADALGLSLSRVKDFRAGTAYTAGRSAEPDRVVLLAMSALKAGLTPYRPPAGRRRSS